MKGGGVFSNANHLLVLEEEMRDGQKNWDEVNDTTFKGLVQDFLGTYRRLSLWVKNAGDWLSVHSTTVSGTLFLATEFCDFLCA